MGINDILSGEFKYGVVVSEGWSTSRYELLDGEFAVALATVLKKYHVDSKDSEGKPEKFEVKIVVENNDIFDDKKCDCKCNREDNKEE